MTSSQMYGIMMIMIRMTKDEYKLHNIEGLIHFWRDKLQYDSWLLDSTTIVLIELTVKNLERLKDNIEVTEGRA